MRITLSVAVTADGFLDDTTSRRLCISTEEDWAAVCRLRTMCDAILVGAETLRRDNPSLLLRDEKTRLRRREAGLKPDIAKVTLTASGNLSPDLNFFTRGDADRYVFSVKPLPALEGLSEVIVQDAPLTARDIVSALEKRGVRHLLVEGGSHILEMFLREGLADTLRLARNPQIVVGDGGYAPFGYIAPKDAPCLTECLGGMEVATYTLRPDSTEEDLRRLEEAIAESRHCTPSQTSYCVGAVIVTARGEVFRGYTHETSPTHHAEQEAILKALAAGADLRGGSIYSSMEPCSKRASEPKSCSELILHYGFSHVAFALYEPSRFVCCHGASMLREAGVDVRVYPELGDRVLDVNAHLFR